MIAAKDVRRQIGGSPGADRTTLRYLVDGEELHHSKRAYLDHEYLHDGAGVHIANGPTPYASCKCMRNHRCHGSPGLVVDSAVNEHKAVL